MAFLNSLIASSSQPRSASSMPRELCSSDRTALSCPFVSRPMVLQITQKNRPGLPRARLGRGGSPDGGQSPDAALYLPKLLRFLLDFTVAFTAVLVAWLPARLSVVPANSSRMSRPKTVTTPMAATATSATMIRYSLIPCPDCDRYSRRNKRPIFHLPTAAYRRRSLRPIGR